MLFVEDIVGQCMEQRNNENNPFLNGYIGNLDLFRLARFSIMEIFLQTPVMRYYYISPDHYLPPTCFPWSPTKKSN